MNPTQQEAALFRDPESPAPRDGALIVAEDNNPFVGLFSVKRLAASVARDLDLPLSEVLSPNRKREFALARAIAAHFAQKRGMSCKRIGQALDRDHSTIIHSLRNLEGWLGLYSNARASFDRHARMFDAAKGAHNAHVLAWQTHMAMPPVAKPVASQAASLASKTEIALFKAARAHLHRDENNRRAGSAALSQAIARNGGWRA